MPSVFVHAFIDGLYDDLEMTVLLQLNYFSKTEGALI